ncbi:hypothetical protein LWC34_19675 [Kibdelosporangium philippinense]|uniref:Uncharacterized protein n=1 Tax=Kibdelosporangium philippinense TaxID=211113 RepID=A0ABS8ZB49_9PSEU|nr:hypothetical protein [Kibdelosporangium philippinense]MCE7005030.1 hypothetical protein [Kibdelosporangium philippinense]
MARMLIWLPAPVDDVRAALHKSGIASGVAVPVRSGTVIVSRDRMGGSIALQWVYGFIRQSRKSAVAVAWDDNASLIYAFSGAVSLGWEWGGDKAVRDLMIGLSGRKVQRPGLALLSALTTSKQGQAKQGRAANRIATALGADEATVLRYVQQHEQRMSPAGFLDDIGKSDVAAVVRAMDVSQFDAWRTGRSFMSEFWLATGAAALACVVLFVAGRNVINSLGESVASIAQLVVLVLMGISFLIAWQRVRYRTTRQPIDDVLPVVELPSDNQSAR